MATALLILFGGRSMPNMLTIIHEQPEMIIAIVSRDEIQRLPQLQSAIDALCEKRERKPQLDASYIVDAFKWDDTYQQCLQAVANHPGFDWIFNITAATTIMSIGAYEASKALSAQKLSVRCWYLNTARSSVVPLIGSGRDHQIFHVDLSQYVAVYNCRLVPGILEDQREHCQEHWTAFSEFLVRNPYYIDVLKKDILKLLYGKPGKPSKKGGALKYSLPSNTEAYKLLEIAYKLGLVDDLEQKDDVINWKLSYTQANFLDGPWLEAYVWCEATKLKLFSDCQWNQKLVDPKKTDDKENKNELDVTMIYNAQLLLAECKTGDDAFDSNTLYKLDSVTGPLGGRFVGKMLITSQPAPNGKDRNKQSTYEDFKNRADDRGIVIVTREELGNLGIIIEQQIKHPKHARI